MEIDKTSPTFTAAIRDFHRARQHAVLEMFMAHLTRKSASLLAYDDIRQQLKAGEPVHRGLAEIPLDAIVGSVGRYTDFTRSFLPRSKTRSQRWAEVKAAIDKLGQMPPIIVYQIGQAYFVLDGNHRVSIARQRGDTHIPAYVTEIQIDVPLSPEVQPNELICQARYADFLERTRLNKLRPEADLSVTVPGQYRILEEQIEIHRRWLGEQQGQDIPDREAVEHWYDTLYLPGIQLIRDRGLLRHFPQRTETDLYAWLVTHRTELQEMLGREVDPEIVADDLVTQFSPKPERVVARVKARLLDALTPDPLEAGPPPGRWRREQRTPPHAKGLFRDILIPVSGGDTGWQAFRQALVVAQREGGRLHGLHVLSSTGQKDTESAHAIKAEFEERCQMAHIAGDLTVKSGKVTREICEQARWTDLVVVGLSHLPRPQPGDRLISGFGTLIRRCPRPVLAVPGGWSPLDRALLAYDGSPKANEALFVAAYLSNAPQFISQDTQNFGGRGLGCFKSGRNL
ncbi:MAG: universal stress protein [Anaerolineae bacterium]